MNSNSTIPLASGATMPVLGLGTWQLTENTVPTIHHALENGYRMIDTSSDYGTQTEVGQAVRSSGIDRSHLYIVTKVEETDDGYEAAKASIAEMGLEYADLVLIHRPPIADNAGDAIWSGLIQARDEGYIRDIGVSNYSIELIEKLTEASGERPPVNQIEWSPFGHSSKMLEYAKHHQMVLQAYSPLTRAKRLDDATLGELATRHERTPAQILLRWNLQKGAVPLPKAAQQSHGDENIDIFDFSLSDKDMELLDSLNEEYSALAGLPYLED